MLRKTRCQRAASQVRPLQYVAWPSRLTPPMAIDAARAHQKIQTPYTPSCRHFSGSGARYADLIVQVPPMAESISEGTLATIHKKVGDRIGADEEIASIETDKIDVAVNAAAEGVVAELLAHEGDVVTVGQPIARIETGPRDSATTSHVPEKQSSNKTAQDDPAPVQKESGESKSVENKEQTIESSTRSARRAAPTSPSPASPPQPIDEHAVDPKRKSSLRGEHMEKMSRMRKTIATRLKQSQNTCASLTSVQEIDMTALMQWRVKYKEDVAKQYGVRLGYMGAFAKATALAAKQVPEINASIDTDREVITYRNYVDISIAVSSPKGLVTPVVRDCDLLSIIELEKEIAIVAQKAREAKLTMDDLTGGNFSISNPGIFNSLFGTPVINYPQAAVFNMNTIKDRVIAVDGKPEIRPMMYITVTYDHRLIDGREAVSFLNIVKNYIEDPAQMLLE
ncbi:putative dihydrolipoamide succinyltransferase [Fusarium oxysporum]|nr:putative dihydrolipoamide succinyltransferase [Fusarium oxysporum]